MTPSKIPIRHRYLTYFRKYKTASVADLVRVMNVTPANVRHHLSGLVLDGLIEVLETKKSDHKGRPIKIYGISRLVQGDNIIQLADALLSERFSNVSDSEFDEAIGKIANRMIEQTSLISVNFSKKLGLVVDQLNKMNYQTRWEAHGRGPRVIFESCPYASVISNHPELCRMDLRILQNYFGGDVEQIARRERGVKNIPVCIFALHEKT